MPLGIIKNTFPMRKIKISQNQFQTIKKHGITPQWMYLSQYIALILSVCLVSVEMSDGGNIYIGVGILFLLCIGAIYTIHNHLINQALKKRLEEIERE